jgi:hypothetical protein
MPQPTEVLVVQDAGRKHHDFGRRIERIATECAPLVEEVTGLPMPPRLVIRLLTRRAWRQAATAARKRTFMAEAAELQPSFVALVAARKQVKLERKVLLATWMLCGPRTITAPDGDEEIIMAPAAARGAGRYDDEVHLYLAMAHELIHPAQCHTSPQLTAAGRTFFTAERAVADRALRPFIEGHATWGGLRIRTKLLGPDARELDDPPASRLFRLVAKGTGLDAYRQDTYLSPVEFITRVIEGNNDSPGLGIERFNRLLRHPDLLPTREEITAPDDWLKRIAQQVPAATECEGGPAPVIDSCVPPKDG